MCGIRRLWRQNGLAIATQIGAGALRYFMLRYTRNTVIAFDFKDALSFEGETGPYVQYAIVRALNIFRKAGTTAEDALAAMADSGAGRALDSEFGTSLWETWLLASKLTLIIEQGIATSEPAYPGEVCVSTGTAVQQFLSPAPCAA